MNTYKRLWLKTWPKLLVTAFGVACYWAADWIPVSHKSLIENIAANLISIPVIFLIYEIWNEKSHAKLYENVYRYAGNEMSLAMADAKSEIEVVLLGLSAYLEGRPLLMDDENPPDIRIIVADGVYVVDDEDEGEQYLSGHDSGEFVSNQSSEDLFLLTKASIVPLVSETFYLGYQVHGFRVDKVVERVDGLMRNAFIMERMDDRQASIVVELYQALRMLQAFMDSHDDLFLRSSSDVEGLIVEVNSIPSPEWRQVDLILQVRDVNNCEYRETIDSCIFPANGLDGLTAIHVVNPDYYIIFGDLVHQVIECIGHWKKETSHAAYLDFEQTRLGVL